MIVKYFHCNIWHLSENSENTAYVFGAPDSDQEVEQNERVLAASWRYLMMNKTRGQRRRMAKAYLCYQIDMHMMYKQVLEE